MVGLDAGTPKPHGEGRRHHPRPAAATVGILRASAAAEPRWWPPLRPPCVMMRPREFGYVAPFRRPTPPSALGVAFQVGRGWVLPLLRDESATRDCRHVGGHAGSALCSSHSNTGVEFTAKVVIGRRPWSE